MDIAWYKAVIDGRTQDLLKLMKDMPDPNVVWRDVTPLHVALRRGKVELAQEIARRYPQLVTQRDTSGETPLHCTLVAGHESFLLWWLELTANDLESGRVVSTEATASNYLLDSASRSLLYLAAERSTPELVQALLTSPLGSTNSGPNQLTALHAAIFRYEQAYSKDVTEIIQALMNHQPQLRREKDVFGNTPLHYAAALERGLDLVDTILRSDISAAYILNEEGLSPVHVAASLGRVATFQRLVESCPDSGFATTASGRNVLHLSVQARRKEMVRHILATRELSNILINGKDGDGNTPYHLSPFSRVHIIRRLLLQNDKLDRKAWNNEGLPARDVAQIKRALKWTAPPDPLAAIHSDQKFHGFARMKFMRNKVVNARSDAGKDSRKEGIENLRNSTNILMLMATLIITVTFTAAVTIPGGYNDSEPDKGMATLAKSAALQLFLMFDSLSLCCSALALYHLALGTIVSSPSLLTSGPNVSFALIADALAYMLWAFAAGIYSVMEARDRTTAIFIVIITSFVPVLYFCDLFEFADLLQSQIRQNVRFPCVGILETVAASIDQIRSRS